MLPLVQNTCVLVPWFTFQVALVTRHQIEDHPAQAAARGCMCLGIPTMAKQVTMRCSRRCCHAVHVEYDGPALPRPAHAQAAPAE